MPYERQLENIWARLNSPSAPAPRHAISTRLAFDDVCAAFMQAELGPDLAGAWGISRSGEERRGDRGGRGRGRGRGRRQRGGGRNGRRGRDGEYDQLGGMMSDKDVFRAEWNVWAYYYGENDPFPGIDPSIQPPAFVIDTHGEPFIADYESRIPVYPVQSSNILHGDTGIGPPPREDADSRRTGSHVPDYAVQDGNARGGDGDTGPSLREHSGGGDGWVSGGQKAKVAIEERANEAEKFMRDQQERRRDRRERKIKDGWLVEDANDVERERGSRRYEQEGRRGREPRRELEEREEARKKLDAREWRSSQGQDRGAYVESQGYYGGLSHGHKSAVEGHVAAEEQVHQPVQSFDRREIEYGLRADGYGGMEGEHHKPDAYIDSEEKLSKPASARKRRRERQKWRKPDHVFADGMKTLKDHTREKSRSPGRAGSGRQWSGNEFGGRNEGYRKREYDDVRRQEYGRREETGRTDYADDLRWHRDTLSGDHAWNDDNETYVRYGGSQREHDKRYDHGQDTGFKSSTLNKRSREQGADQKPFRQPSSLRREDGGWLVKDYEGVARTSGWVQEEPEQVHDGFQEHVYEPRYPRHGEADKPFAQGGRDRGFGVMKDAGDYHKEDHQRHHEG